MVACKTETEQPETPSDTGKNRHRKKEKTGSRHGKQEKEQIENASEENRVRIVYPDKKRPQNKKRKKKEIKTTVV